MLGMGWKGQIAHINIIFKIQRLLYDGLLVIRTLNLFIDDGQC